MQPRKVRIIADQVSGKPAVMMTHVLNQHSGKSARLLRKVLISAIANAQENHQLHADDLKIARIMVDEGPRGKRIEQRAMGRGNRIVKKTSHITVVVTEAEAEARVRPHGTKPKPRPTFAATKKGKKKVADAAPVEAAAAEVVEAPIDSPVEKSVVAEEGSSETAVEVETAPVPEAAESEPIVAEDESGEPAKEVKGED